MTPPLIFITGVTGFIGAHVLETTLRAGYRARVSVRKSEQIELVRQHHQEVAQYIEFVVIPDIARADAFEKALEGVHYIFHLASPMPGKGEDIRTDYVEPAVKGTEAILQAANAHPLVKTVIIVSSVLGIGPINATKLPAVNVKDNTNKVIQVDLNMDIPSGPDGYGIKYTASKILAHQASRDFMSQKTPHFKLITFHPVFVLGPDLHQTSAETVGGINKFVWKSFGSEKPLIANAWVHVDDVAEAFIRALRMNEKIASGTEFLLSAPVFKYEDAMTFVKKNYPAVDLKWQPPFPFDWHIDTSTADGILGIQWKDEKHILRDLIDQQLSFVKGSL